MAGDSCVLISFLSCNPDKEIIRVTDCLNGLWLEDNLSMALTPFCLA